MAIIRGGLHGRPSGNVAGVVYGAARTRTGKAVTARELVYPSNPQTAEQMLQRHIFMESLFAVRVLGASWWQDDFNRSIGQLPGFHSMMSILLNNTNASEEFISPPDTPLGDLHFPGTFTVVTGAGAAGTVTIDWTAETGANGTAADVLMLCTINKDAAAGYIRGAFTLASGVTRSTTTLVWACGFVAADVVICGYFAGAGAAIGINSLARWTDVISHA